MSRSDRYDDEDDDRPSRRSRRRADRWDEGDDADDPGDAPRPRPAGKPPGYGLGIAAFVCGLVAVVLAVVGGGPMLCSMCCLFLMPVTWVVAGAAALCGATGTVLGFVARSQGNPTAFPIFGIVSGLLGVVLAVAAVVLPIVFVANMPFPPPNNNPGFNQPGQPKRF